MPINTLVQLFAKLPVAGEVKTRLIPEIGVNRATAVYRHCLQHCIGLVDSLPLDHELWVNRLGEDPLFAARNLHMQKGRNLGEKMFNALRQGLQSHQKVILIGSDCLDLRRQHFDQVSAQLDHHDLVFIPAFDGGYVLVGARQPVRAEIFENIAWSTEQVMQQTLEQARRHKVSYCVLNSLRDIDQAADLQHYAELNSLLNSID